MIMIPPWHEGFNPKFNRFEMISNLRRVGGLRIMILHVLEDEPKNGVEIMDAIEKQHRERHETHHHHTKQHYHHHRKHTHPKRPSPGSIYPMLKKMVEEDLIKKRDDGKYELTEKGEDIAQKIFGHFGRRHKQRFTIADAIIQLDSYISYLDDIKTEKLTPHLEELKAQKERLSKIIDSIPKE